MYIILFFAVRGEVMLNWGKAIASFCVVFNGFVVKRDILDTAFQNWNAAVGKDILRFNCTTESNMIFLGPTRTGALGTTTYSIKNAKIDSVKVHIDTRVAQSAGLFYNILLHEMGHVLGLPHSTNTSSIMSFKSQLTPTFYVLQNRSYGDISEYDGLMARAAFGSSMFTSFNQTKPVVAALSHVSGLNYTLPVLIRLPRSKMNIVSKYWKFY